MILGIDLMGVEVLELVEDSLGVVDGADEERSERRTWREEPERMLIHGERPRVRHQIDDRALFLAAARAQPALQNDDVKVGVGVGKVGGGERSVTERRREKTDERAGAKGGLKCGRRGVNVDRLDDPRDLSRSDACLILTIVARRRKLAAAAEEAAAATTTSSTGGRTAGDGR